MSRVIDLRADIKTGDGTILRHRTVSNLIDALDWAINEETTRCSIEGSPRFCGTSGAKAYAKMLREGWPEGIKGVEGLEGLSIDAADKLTFVRSVAGAFPVIPALLAGAPDNMLMPHMLPADCTRGLTLIVDGSFNFSVTASTAKEYAESVMRLVSWLSAEHIETAIYMSVCVRSYDDGRVVYLTPIRQPGEVIMPERIAALVHPSFLRRAWFALLEYEHYQAKLPRTSHVKGGYGGVTAATADELRQLIPEAYSVILLPKVGSGDPMKAVQESSTLKLRHEV